MRTRRTAWLAAAALLLTQGAVSAEASTGKRPTGKPIKRATRPASSIVQTASGLRYRIVKAGSGPRPTDDDVALINYTGKLLSGAIFDRSTEPTPLPVARVVPGFAESLKLMRKGAKYRVWIPASLGYGAKEMKDGDRVVIPANSVLVFDIELIDFLPGETPDLAEAFQRSAASRPTGATKK